MIAKIFGYKMLYKIFEKLISDIYAENKSFKEN